MKVDSKGKWVEITEAEHKAIKNPKDTHPYKFSKCLRRWPLGSFLILAATMGFTRMVKLTLSSLSGIVEPAGRPTGFDLTCIIFISVLF